MFVLFEESGAFKAGSVLTDNNTSLQINTTHGKRLKIKSNAVLLNFQTPEPEQLLPQAEQLAVDLDAAFLWDVCDEEEFMFDTFANAYFGHTPTPVEATAMLLCLHRSPVYFHRKGKGKFRRSPPDILQAALAGLEKKRIQAETIERIRAALVAGQLPDELSALVPQLLYRPDRNQLESKAFEAACVDSGLSAPHLMLHCGALASSYHYHLNRFLFNHFPNGTTFADIPDLSVPDNLPIAEVSAFSIDDAFTTEIDDAFSVTPLAEGGWRIGIHIAMPALGIQPGSNIDVAARQRLSTVYMPGDKITMLPDKAVQQFTLAENTTPPAISLYLTVSPALAPISHESKIERVPIAANLRIHQLEPLFNEETLANGLEVFDWHEELSLLWRFATILEAGRGKSGDTPQQVDFNFAVDWQQETSEGLGFVTINPRLRGSPLEKLVSELMILTNSTWGKMLDEAEVPGLYRVQNGGKVRMSTYAEPHDALGVDCYAWSSSPLRRYVDLINQWQILSVLQQRTAPFSRESTDLMAILRDFEVTYAAYAEFQRQMERYWCLRCLRQNNIETLEAQVLKDNVVRVKDMPLVTKVSAMPPQLVGSWISVQVTHTDLLDLTIDLRYQQTLTEPDNGGAGSEA